MDFRLLPMDRSTVPDVAAIERECFSQPWSEDMLAEELYNDNASFIVAVADDGTVLGYAGLTVVLDEGYINNVAVKSQYRRMGVADALLGTFIRFAEEPSGLPHPGGAGIQRQGYLPLYEKRLCPGGTAEGLL